MAVHVHIARSSMPGLAQPRTMDLPWQDGLTARQAAQEAARWLDSIDGVEPGWVPDRHAFEAPEPEGIYGARNGRPLPRGGWDAPILDGDHVTLLPRAGIGDPFTLTWWVTTIFFNVAASMVLKALFGPPKQTAKPGDEASPTYAFDQIHGLIGEGAPVPVVYGEHRLGGLVVGSHVSLIGPFQQRLNLLIALCDGEIEGFGGANGFTEDTEELTELPGIAGTATEFSLSGENLNKAGVQINDQPAGNFGGTVRAWTRRGKLHQALLPNFPDTILQKTVDTVLEASASVPGLPSTPGQYVAASVPSWVGFPFVAYTMTDEANRFAARLRWKLGQFDIDQGSGALIPNPVTVQIRYRAVDDLGVPFGDYYVLPPQTIQLTSQSAFSVDLEHVFSGDGYEPPTVGNALVLDGANDYAEKTNPNKIPTTSGPETRIAFLAWIKPDSASDNNWLFFHLGGSSGFTCRIRRDPADSTKAQVEVVMRAGSSQTFVSPSFPAGDLVGKWNIAGFCYTGSEPSFGNPNGDGNLRMFFGPNGAKVADIVIPGTFRPLWASSSTTLFIGRQSAASSFYHGSMDHVLLFSRSVSDAEVTSLATKDKYGNVVDQVDPSDELVGFWKFDGNGNDSAAVGTPNNLTLQGGATAGGTGIVATPEIVVPEQGRYLVEILRVDVATSEDNQFAQDETTWTDILLISDQPYEFPGTALLALEISGSEDLQGQAPKVTDLIRGRKVPVWDGVSAEFPTFLTQWSATPSWCLLDAATNPDYGMASTFAAPLAVDLEAFLQAAEHADERLHDGKSEAVFDTALSFSSGEVTIEYDAPGPPQFVVDYEIAITDTGTDFDTEPFLSLVITEKSEASGVITLVATWPEGQADPVDTPPTDGTIEGREARSRCDMVFDEGGVLGWDALLSIARCGRAVPVRLGSRLSLFVNKATPSTQLVTMGSSVRRSVLASYQGIGDRPNSFDVEFWNRDQNYERTPTTIDADSLVDPALFDSFRKRREQYRGATRESQVRRDYQLRLRTFEVTRRTIEFDLSPDGIAILPGDVFEFAHDLTVGQKDPTSLAVSGRIQSDSAAADGVVLDRDFTFTAGETYEIQIRNSLTDALELIAIDASMVPGGGTSTVAAGSPITLATAAPWTPAKDDLYAIGMTGFATRRYRAMRIEPNWETFRRRIMGLEYDEDVYDVDAEFGPVDGSLLASVLTPPPMLRDTAAPPTVVGLVVAEQTYRSASGAVRNAVIASWEHTRGAAQLVGGAIVWARREGEMRWTQVADVKGGVGWALLENLGQIIGATWEVTVQAYSTSGAKLPVEVGPVRSIVIQALTQRPAAILGTRGELRGGDSIYAWQRPTETHIRWIEARIGGWVLGQRMFKVDADRAQSPPLAFWVENPTNWRADPAPSIRLAPVLESGVIGAFTKVTLSPNLVGFGSALVSTAVEDNWAAGTLNDLEDHPDISHALRFAGSALSASYVSETFDLGSAMHVQASAFYVAHQKHPFTLDDLVNEYLSHLELQRWLFEGPAWLLPGEDECDVTFEWSYSDTGSPGSNWTRFEPGVVYLRSCRFRLSFNRPSTDFNVNLRRLGVVLREPPAMGGSGSGLTHAQVMSRVSLEF